MRRLHLLYVIFAFASLFLLSACGGGDGYSSRTWDPNAPQSPAQSAPNPLSTAGTPAEPVQTPVPVPDDTLPPVKVALLLPLTGKHEPLGQAMLDAAQVALFDVGYSSFELMPRDTGGTASGAASAAQAALTEGAQLILGPVFAEEVRAVRPIAQSANVNIIGFSTDWSLAGDNTFIMGFLPFDQVERVTRYAAANNLTQIGVLAPSTDYGRVVTSAFDSIAPRVGVRAAAKTALPASNANLDQTIRTFTRYNASAAPGSIPPPPFSAVLMPVGGDTAQSVGALLSTYGMPPNTVKRLGTGLFDDPALAADRNLNGAWFAAPSPRLRQDFERRFNSTYHYAPPRLATLAYDATALASVLAQRGLQAGGRPAFDRDAITNPNGFAGIDGIFRFRANGTAERGLAILEFSNGQIRIVDDAPRTFQQATQ
jgi:branched-chain amino acid transport system substrate-binding protein